MSPRQFVQLTVALTCAATTTCVAIAAAILTPADDTTREED